MDARLDRAKYAGRSEGDAHVIRDAGGRASDDAIRSLVISHKLLGTNEWFVIQHTNCGMELFCDEIMAGLLDDHLATVTFMARTGPTHSMAAAAQLAISSNGTRSSRRRIACYRTCGAFASIR